MSPGGYFGRALVVDIDGSSASASTFPLGDTVLRQYLGGVGLGTWLLHELAPPRVDPLAPEAPLLFVFSPLVGTPLTTSAKFAVVGKSPLTGLLTAALASSRIAIAGKLTGHDAIAIRGRADELSVLLIDTDGVRLEGAPELAERRADEAEEMLRERFGEGWRAAVIGPAGERGVRFATISHDGRHSGRGGLGAVLGAKNVKAVLVRGSVRSEVADPHAVRRIVDELRDRSDGPSDLEAARSSARSSCTSCTVGCTHIYPRKNGRKFLAERRNAAALGPPLGIVDPDDVLLAGERCDDYGIDTLTTAATIAWAMACAERGLIDEPWLRFGDATAVLRAIAAIGHRSPGLGRLLAEGSSRAAEIVGDGPADVEPRTVKAEAEARTALMDSLVLCSFLRAVFDNDPLAEWAELLRAVTGWDVDASELQDVAHRIVRAKRLYNLREGAAGPQQ